MLILNCNLLIIHYFSLFLFSKCILNFLLYVFFRIDNSLFDKCFLSPYLSFHLLFSLLKYDNFSIYILIITTSSSQQHSLTRGDSAPDTSREIRGKQTQDSVRPKHHHLHHHHLIHSPIQIQSSPQQWRQIPTPTSSPSSPTSCLVSLPSPPPNHLPLPPPPPPLPPSMSSSRSRSSPRCLTWRTPPSSPP